MKRFGAVALAALVGTWSLTSVEAGKRFTIPAGMPALEPLWQGEAPGAKGKDENDIPGVRVYPAPADKANGTAVVVCPGGGYGFLAMDHEGHQIGQWLNSLGITAVVLQYRLAPTYRHPIPLGDAQRAPAPA